MASSRKYMVRNGKGKEFGPYNKDQILKFLDEGKLKPTTNLRLVDGSGVATVQDLIQQEESQDNKTNVARLDKLKKMREKIEGEKKVEQERIEQEKVKEEFKRDLESEKFEEFKFEKEAQVPEEPDFEEIDNKIADDSVEKTVIIRPNLKSTVDNDATVVLQSETAIKVSKQSKNSTETNMELDDMLGGSGSFQMDGEGKTGEVNTLDSASEDDSTRMIQSGGLDAGIRMEARNAEREIQDEIQNYKKELESKANEFADDEDGEEYEEEEEETNTKKKIGPIFAILFIAISYMFMSDDDEKKFQPPKYLRLSEPVFKEFSDEVKSSQLYDKAVLLYLKGSYKTKLAAISKLKQSLSYNAKNEKTVDLLIYLYADLLENAKDEQSANKYLYALIRQNRSRINKSHFLAAGTSKFFMKIRNSQAAYNTIWNYVQLFIREKLDAADKGVNFARKQHPIVWAIYLEAQIEMNLLGPDEAEKNYNLLRKIPKKPIEIYQALFKFLKATDKTSDYFELLSQARKEYPGSVYLLMLYTDFLFIHGDLQEARENKEALGQFKSYKKALKEMSFLNFEGSPFYYARLLEHKGMAAGLLGKQKKAIIYIKRSLKVLENRELRRKLSLFELMEKDNKGTEKIVNSIINESKVLNAIEDSLAALKTADYEQAILKAIEATSILPNDNRARLNLARMQISRGYFELALRTLEEIAADNIMALDIQVELVRGYIKAKKIRQAELQIAKLLKTDKMNFSSSWQYPSLVGRIYNVKGNLGLAINKIQQSINRNPLNADDLFLLSEIFLKFRKYKRCKYYLTLAMELDPNNIDYHITYAKTIYELQDANTAIGYLKRRLDKWPTNARIMGAIANYYYLSGSNKEFEMYRNKLKLVDKQDKYMYEFLVKASINDEKWDDVINYAKKLIVVDPSDLDAYMILGENLYNRRRYDDALNVFEQVEERLSTYQRLHYYKAKVLIGQQKYQEALDEAELEIKANEQSSAGYTIKGSALIKLERFPEAINALKMGVSRDGKDVEALMSLADVRFQQDKYDEARELYNRVKKVDPNNPILFRQLGHIYRKIGQPGLAIENYKVYLDQNPTARDRSNIEGIIQAIQ